MSSRLQAIELLPALRPYPQMCSATVARRPVARKMLNSAGKMEWRGSKRVDWLANFHSQPWLQGIELRHLGRHEWWQRARSEVGMAMAGAKAVEFSAS